MEKYGPLNILIGFILLVSASFAGYFLGHDANQAFIHQTGELASWGYALRRSAHGHGNLFGMLHILYGLTLPYSSVGQRTRCWQTVGLSMGSLAMAFVMVIRAARGVPGVGFDLGGSFVGLLLLGSLTALLSHCFGLAKKVFYPGDKIT